MSAQQTFALCIDCWEFHYGISDSNGVYSRDSGSSNHFDCAVHVFRAPTDYPPPIKGVLVSLQRGEAISAGRLDIFSLACAVTAIQPNNGRKVAPEDLGAVELHQGHLHAEAGKTARTTPAPVVPQGALDFGALA